MAKKKKLPLRSYFAALWFISKRSYRIAPSLAILQLIDSLVGASLPIATTYFAALTTTALAGAYAGEADAASQALTYVIITSVLGIVSLIWSTISTFLSTRGRYKISAAVEDEMMTQFTHLPFSDYDDKKIIDMHDKAQRFSAMFSNVFSRLGQILTSIITAIGAMIALVSVSPLLGLIIFIVVLPRVIINIRLARAQTDHWETNITNRRRMWDLEWTLRRPEIMAEMRVYGVIKSLIRLYDRYRDQDQKERMELELRSGWKQLAANILESITELGALMWITLQIIGHAQPVGQFVFVQQMVSRVMSGVGSFATELGNFDEDFAHMIDYQEFMSLDVLDEVGDTVTETPETISFDGVSFRYPHSRKLVIRDVSLSVQRGQKVAIVGENGAGKSTMVKLLLGLYKPTRGTVRLDDTSLQAFTLSSWHHQIGLLWQGFVRYDFGTIRENIELGDIDKAANKSSIETAMKQSEFASVVGKLERGADTFINKWMGRDDDDASATELSGGQYQRLALARNFYRDAPIVILDEPTSAIDSLAESRIFQRLFSMKSKTIITISHRYSTVKKADHIYVMKDGRIVEQGTAVELIASKGEFYQMFESQIS